MFKFTLGGELKQNEAATACQEIIGKITTLVYFFTIAFNISHDTLVMEEYEVPAGQACGR